MSKKVEIAYGNTVDLALEELNDLQGNLKELSEGNFFKLRSHILDTGFSFAPHVWLNNDDGKYYLVDGHQRARVLRQLKEEGYEIPAIKCVPVEAETYADAINRILQSTSQFGQMSEEGLDELIQAGGGYENFNLDGFRLPDLDMSYFADIPGSGIGSGSSEEDEDEEEDTRADELPEVAQNELGVVVGDLYQLGDHRLLCGDCTDKANVDRLMDGQDANMVFTDPPYGIDVVKPDGNIGGTRKDDAGKPGYRKVACGVYNSITGDDKPFDPTPLLSLAPQQIIWGANNFASKLPDNPQWIVWYKDMPEDNDFSGAELAWTNIKKKSVKTYKFVWAGMTREGNRKDELTKKVHPTQKPVGLFEKILNDYNPGSVIDLYLGSGTTLIACEKTKRKCYGMEIDPHYCSVIIKRWEEYTGNKVEKLA